jgi:hypothetical protein
MKNDVQLMNLYPLTCPPVFMLSLLERNLRERTSLKYLFPYFESMARHGKENEIFSICHDLSMAVLHYDEEALAPCLSFLQNLLNFPALKKYPAIETEIKLFHTFVLLVMEKTDLAETGLRSIVRKNPVSGKNADQIQQFILLLKLSLSNKSAGKQKKIFEAFKLYQLLERSENASLSYVKWKEKHILQLSMY